MEELWRNGGACTTQARQPKIPGKNDYFDYKLDGWPEEQQAVSRNQ
jgi:hypothetical protein